MRALVTGATGFLGRRLARELAARGFDVTTTGRNETIGAGLTAEGFRFVGAELENTRSTNALVAEHDVVFHSAALSSPWGAYEDFHRANVVATRNVVDACLAHRVKRLVHVSTPSLYATPRDRLGVREDEPLPAKSINDYAATKRLAEAEVDRGFARGLEVVTLRPQGIFGPGDTAIIPRLLRANQEGGVPWIRNGEALVDATFVDDVVHALLLAATASSPALGRKFNITSGEPKTFAELFGALFAEMGVALRKRRIPFAVAYALATALELAARAKGGDKEPKLTRYAVTVLGNSRTLDCTAAKTALGYEPQVGVSEGIRRSAKSYAEAHARSVNDVRAR